MIDDMIEIESLNEYSRKVYDFLKSHYPTFLDILVARPCKNYGSNCIKFEIIPPNKNASYKLTFDTNDNQITVCFDNFHCHYDNFANLNLNNELNKSIGTINKIMSQELIVVSYYRDNKLIMTGLNEKSIFNNLDKAIPATIRNQVDRINAISWRGTLDEQELIN